MTSMIEEMTAEDWSRVRAIYVQGIETGDATFETSAPSWEQWDAKHCPVPRLVLRIDDEIAGWAALSPYSSRDVYRGVGEVSIYVAADRRGAGLGHILLEALISRSEETGFWTLQAGIFPENQPSVELHRRHGFVIAGKRERIGKLAGVWRDVLLMERRSRQVGWDEV